MLKLGFHKKNIFIINENTPGDIGHCETFNVTWYLT
jgi:hypothetical protein